LTTRNGYHDELNVPDTLSLNQGLPYRSPERGWSRLRRQFRRGFLPSILYLEDESAMPRARTSFPAAVVPRVLHPKCRSNPNSVDTQTTRISMHLHRESAGSAAGIGVMCALVNQPSTSAASLAAIRDAQAAP
jgi:hypothetical protein